MKRRVITLLMVAVGFGLQALAYFFLATPLGRPSGVRFSNPRVPFAPALFILGVILVFLAGVAYELTPDRPGRSTGEG